MSTDDLSIQFHEYPDADLPHVFRIQVLDFQRIVWPDGFTGINRFRDWTTDPVAVLTYPAFRGEGWSSRLNARAAELIDASGADIGLLTCALNLIGFYSRAGWTHAQGTPIIAGPDGATWTSQDVLLTRPTSPSSAGFLRDIKDHPLRIADEW